MSKPSRQTEVLVLHYDGKTPAEIAQILGMSRMGVYRYLPPLQDPKELALAAESWRQFLTDPDIATSDPVRVNDTALQDERWVRAFYRWREEMKYGPSLRVVDEFLCHVGLHLDDFLNWCAARGLPAWASEAPEWEICREDYEVRVGEPLRERLCAGLPFERAWLEALAEAGPPPPGWNDSPMGDPTPMDVLRRAMKREYNAARRRIREAKREVLLV